MRRSVVVGLACGAVATAALVAGGGVGTHVAGGDLHGMYLPRYEAAAQAARALRLPLWNPFELCGTPLLATAQGAAAYPPMLLLFAFLAPGTALTAFYAVHLLLLAVATVAYLRRHGIDAGAAAAGAVLAAAVVLGPLQPGLDHPSFLAATAWLPVMLACAEDAWGGGGRRAVAGLALAAAAQWLAGYPEFAMDAAVIVVVVALISPGATATRRLGAVAIGLGLGAALAGVQLVPLAEAVAESSRAAAAAGYASLRGGLAIHSLADLGRRLADHYRVLPLVVAPPALVRPTRVRLAWLAALAWCVFAHNQPLATLYRLPPFAGVRFPWGWLVMGPWLGACLAAAGIATVAARRPALGGLVAAAVGAYAVLLVAAGPASFPPDAPDGALLAQRLPVLRAAAATVGPHARVLAARELAAGGPLRDRLPAPAGYEPALPPRRIAALLAPLGLDRQGNWGGDIAGWPGIAAHTDLATAMGLGVVVVPEAGAPALERAGFARLATVPPGDVVLTRHPMPRARLVHEAVRVTSEDEALAQVLAAPAALARTAVVEEDVALAEPPPGSAEAVRLTDETPDRIALAAYAASPALVVLADTWYPGWTATVDGKDTRILRVDYAFRGIPLSPGDHNLELRYRPLSFTLGAASSGLALALVLVLLAR